MPDEQSGISSTGQLAKEAAKACDRPRHGHRVIERRSGLHQRQYSLNGRPKGCQALVQVALPLGRADAIELLSDCGEECIAVEVLVLVEVIPNTHAKCVEWR